MLHQLPIRQRLRKALVILTFLSFPITMNYLSPYVIIDGAANGILNASVVMFGLMFVSSLFLGRLWCGWVCLAGGLQEFVEPVNNKPVVSLCWSAGRVPHHLLDGTFYDDRALDPQSVWLAFAAAGGRCLSLCGLQEMLQ